VEVAATAAGGKEGGGNQASYVFRFAVLSWASYTVRRVGAGVLIDFTYRVGYRRFHRRAIDLA